MRPSVKFVSRINGSFLPQKIMGQFFSEKRLTWGGGGGGSGGGLSRGDNFSVFFSLAPFSKLFQSKYIE